MTDQTAVVMPSFRCWILVDKNGATDLDEEFGIGIINGISYDCITAAKGDIFESAQCALNDVEIPDNAIAAKLTVTDLTHEEGQMTFPETCQWDFPPHWEMKMELDCFDLIGDLPEA